ncbi:hypothetical protein Ssi02_39830 [Sinosporangium siamense]|uniref:Uncharacterized protein n=1 Tax=Sinosporangium siamense TaxID=1367973 RepID=A0A919V8Z2_9ACTN|nr:hypothetical protein Ssi02_39830 [Sinosporangium siamense]
MDRVPPEIPQKIGMLLQQRHLDPRTGQQERQDSTGGPTARDHTGRVVHNSSPVEIIPREPPPGQHDTHATIPCPENRT